MALIGFLFCFSVLCLFTILITYLMVAPSPYGLERSERFYGLLAAAIVGLGWYWLFKNASIIFGGM